MPIPTGRIRFEFSGGMLRSWCGRFDILLVRKPNEKPYYKAIDWDLGRSRVFEKLDQASWWCDDTVLDEESKAG